MKKNKQKQFVVTNFLQKNRGVLSVSELQLLLQPSSKLQFYRELKQLEQDQVIVSFCRGIYTSPNPDLQVLSQRIQPQSYLSLGTVLSQQLILGSVPAKTIYAVKLGKSRIYKNFFGEIVQLGIAPELFFGFKNIAGVCVADKEKAFLDTLYYYQKGQKYSFDIFSDINLQLLNRSLIEKYLKKYKNPKFISFVKGVLHD